MNHRALFVIGGDPRTSPRPAEAIRIAAGVSAWKKVNVAVYLHDAAVLALSEYTDELVDEDNFTRFLPILSEPGDSIYVEAKNPLLDDLGEATTKFTPISTEELAALAARHDYLLRF